MLRQKDKPMLAKTLFVGSLLSAIFAALGAFGWDIYLASTQWLLVGILLSTWAGYLWMERK